MSEQARFTLTLEHLEDYEFKVKFDKKALDDMIVDEPPPLGMLAGPNPSRLLAVSAANCLSASLLHCINRGEPLPGSVTTEVTATIVRNEKKRLRIGGMSIKLKMSEDLSNAAKAKRCLALFEDFCVVTDSIRQGIPITVEVENSEGEVVYQNEDEA
ncbi:osmotically inducible protein OsmC [Solemya velum gill symbiont]|uniref:Osmotically inducible protein OsmC n=2 Tax=Solemya velum gill symbiont TaxID=2340 RepID=A0A0B0HGI9_SOVGS|nr:OsmC family protein [Solemya velum gill symbiont]KHF26591.1 redox protein [Solemya velum gill symbiont]OOY36294.1 osmotically inducible protein OsmC [Solemya velum gill symbiont]OOY40882.1 osmotically inducible protein OsmC [Solemya velum gill symbiont]OOY41805.1 osmotically inducible protein OsmC [Solemya velum gill symbiont]OOY52609.1 osmotically inducible protein OsmC [Solemya velum gill symbiont]